MNASDAWDRVRRQLVDRAVRTPGKLAQAPGRTGQLVTAEPGGTPYDVIHEEALVRLRRYEPGAVDAERRHETPVVAAYAFINEPSILDFASDRSVVRGFLERGFSVYVIEWRDPSPIDRSHTLDDYVDRFLPRCVDAARADSGSRSVHLLGYSTSAPIAAAYAALYPERVKTLLLQGPPLDFDPGADGETATGDEGGDGIDLFRTLATTHDPSQVAETFDTVPAPLLDAALALRKPVEYGLTNPLRLWDRLDDDAFVEEYGRKLAWAAGGPDLPGATYEGFLERLLLENRLIRNELRIFGRRVDLGAIEMPVALVIGRDDAFVPRDASLPFLDAVSSDDTVVFEFPTGHVGLSVAPEVHGFGRGHGHRRGREEGEGDHNPDPDRGERAADVGWPAVLEWLEERTEN